MTPPPPEPLWRTEYPFASHWLDLGDARLHYVDEGAGEPLLCVHGNPTWSFMYRRLILGLRSDYRLVAPDHVGCGLSDKPAAYPYRLARRIDDLVRLIETLDLRGATLVAHDWGGAIGLGAVLRTPERFRRIVLLNTGAFPPSYVPWRIAACRTPLLGRVAVQGFNAFARAALTMAMQRPSRLAPAARAGLLAPYDSWSNRRGVYRFVADIPLSRRHPTYRVLEELESGLPSLADRPALLLWGLGDWCFDVRCLDRLVRSLPQAEVERYPDGGHYLIEDQPEAVVARVRRFLGER